MTVAVPLLVLLLATVGCVGRLSHLHVFPRCADQLPAKALLDPRCPRDGVCGYSCLPDRWEEFP